MFIATHTVTRYESGEGNKSSVRLVKGQTYTVDQVAKFPSYYMDYLKRA